MTFSPEELAAMAAADAEIEATFVLTDEEVQLSRELDRLAKGTPDRTLYEQSYYQAHRAERLAYQKDYQQRNREKVSASHAKWYRENKETIRPKQRAYVQKNADAIKARAKAYYQANRETILEKARVRRAQKRGQEAAP